MIQDKNRLRILFVHKNEHDRHYFPEGWYPGIKKIYAEMGNLRPLTCDWEPELIVFSKDISPRKIITFLEWLQEEPFPQTPYAISLYPVSKNISRKIRKVYNQYITEFQKDIASLDIAHFL
jgi:hypothetical protein